MYGNHSVTIPIQLRPVAKVGALPGLSLPGCVPGCLAVFHPREATLPPQHQSGLSGRLGLGHGQAEPLGCFEFPGSSRVGGKPYMSLSMSLVS